MRRYTPILLAALLPVAFLTGFLARGGSTNDESTPTKSANTTVTSTPGEGSVEVGFTRDMSVHHGQAVDMAERIRARSTDDALRLLATDIVLTQQSQIGRFRGWLEQWNLPASSTAAPMLWMTSPARDPGPGDTHDSVPSSSIADTADTSETADSQASSSKTPSTTASAMAEMAGMAGSTPATVMPGMASRADVNALSTLPAADAERSFLQLMIAHHEGGVVMATAVLFRTERPEVIQIAKSIITSQTGEIAAMRKLLATRTTGAP